MEKYEKLFKGLEMCAGPECHEECPYHGETRGGKTCRAWLLNDAAVALMGEESRADEAEAEAKAHNQDAHDVRRVRDAFAAECAGLRTENEFLREKLKETEKHAPPVALNTVEAAAKLIRREGYWNGYADALKWHIHDRFVEDAMVEDVHIDLSGVHGEPEPEADNHV